MICTKRQWALHSGKQDYPDRYWGKLFFVSELEESVLHLALQKVTGK